MILPSARHFRSLSPQHSGEDTSSSFDDEISSDGGSASPTSPLGSYGFGGSSGGGEVKSLFHQNGCLFAYAAPETDGLATGASAAGQRRYRVGRKGLSLSPLSRRRTKIASRSAPHLSSTGGVEDLHGSQGRPPLPPRVFRFD